MCVCVRSAKLRVFADGGANRVYDGMPNLFPEIDPMEVRHRLGLYINPFEIFVSSQVLIYWFCRLTLIAILEQDLDFGSLSCKKRDFTIVFLFLRRS